MSIRKFATVFTAIALMTARALAVTLAWDASTTSGVTYNVYPGTAPGTYPSAPTNVGSVLTAVIPNSGLIPGLRYYAIVTASLSNVESTPSNEVSFVVPASTDANLSSLSPSAGTLAPVLASNTLVYANTVGASQTSIAFTPTASGFGATIKINGASVNSGSLSSQFNLSPGINTFAIVCTAQDGATSKSYSVTVYRRPATPANLRATSLTP